MHPVSFVVDQHGISSQIGGVKNGANQVGYIFQIYGISFLWHRRRPHFPGAKGFLDFLDFIAHENKEIIGHFPQAGCQERGPFGKFCQTVPGRVPRNFRRMEAQDMQGFFFNCYAFVSIGSVGPDGSAQNAGEQSRFYFL